MMKNAQEKKSTSRFVRLSVCAVSVALILIMALGIISASAANEINLKFDDYYDVSGKTVEIVDKGTPTSNKVGYGVAAGTKDDAVVTLSSDGKTLIATGIGTAKVKINGTEHTVTVKPAPLSILLLIGQSNMHGSEGNAAQSIICPDGMVYSTYGNQNVMVEKNASQYAPSALTGDKSTLNNSGTNTYLSTHPVYNLTEKGSGKIGADSGIAYEWVKQTGEKIWVVNAAHGGSDTASWLKTGTQYKECLKIFGACLDTFEREIAAGHYTFSHMGYYWCQGEASADATKSAEWYTDRFLTIHNNLKKDFKIDHDANSSTPDVTFEFAGLIPVRGGNVCQNTYRGGTYSATPPSGDKIYETYFDLVMLGPRVAEYWLGASTEHPDIWNVCTIQFDWAIMPDGSDTGVKAYFQKHYTDGRVDYKTQTAVSESWRKPTTTAHVHDSIHYNQIGYNEIGRESARNTLYMLGMVTPPNEEVTVKFVAWDGITEVKEINACPAGETQTLIVPLVYPVYKSKDVKFELTNGLKYDYYDLTSSSLSTGGTLTPVGAKGTPINVKGATLEPYRWELKDGKLVSVGDIENQATLTKGTYENGKFIDNAYEFKYNLFLMSGENWSLEWKMSGPWYDNASQGLKKLFSESSEMRDVGAGLLMVNGKENSLSLGTAEGRGHIQYGVNLTEYGINIEDSHVYRLVNRIAEDGSNMIYLYVDGKEIAPMNNVLDDGVDTGEDENWVSGKNFVFRYMGVLRYYLDNGVIDYIDYVPAHDHEYTDVVTAPTCTEKGYTTHTCACGDVKVDAYIDPTGHLYDDASDADCNNCGETREVTTNEPEQTPAPGGSETDKPGDPTGGDKGGCSCSNSSAIALISLLVFAQIGVIFRKKRF